PSASQISYATISYGGSNNSQPAGIYINGSSPALSKITVSNCSKSGIQVTRSAATPTIRNATITSKSNFGVNIVSSGGINLSNSTITSNTDYAIGTDVNTRLLGLNGLTITGNGSGAKNGVGYRGGTITTNEAWHVGPTWFVIATATISSTG